VWVTAKRIGSFYAAFAEKKLAARRQARGDFAQLRGATRGVALRSNSLRIQPKPLVVLKDLCAPFRLSRSGCENRGAMMERTLPKGHLSCLSGRFKYTPAISTSIAKTFARIRAGEKSEGAQGGKNVRLLPQRKLG
jgi:hypothetical protein